jgi:hypothetical protein
VATWFLIAFCWLAIASCGSQMPASELRAPALEDPKAYLVLPKFGRRCSFV